MERDRRELERERDDDDRDEQHEGGGWLFAREAPRERQRSHPQAAPEDHKGVVAERGLVAAVAVHLEGERADRYEEREQQRGVDRDGRGEREDGEDRGGGREGGGEEVVRRFVHPHREDEQGEGAEQHGAAELREGREPQLKAEDLGRVADVDGDEERDRRQKDRDGERRGDLYALADREGDERTDTEEHDRERHVSRTARSLRIRKAPASATTTWSQAKSSVNANCGPGMSCTSSSVPVSISRAPSEPRTAPRAVRRMAMPDDSSQNAAASCVTPLGSSPRTVMRTSSFDVVRRNANAAAVVAAATIVASPRRQPGSSP